MGTAYAAQAACIGNTYRAVLARLDFLPFAFLPLE